MIIGGCRSTFLRTAAALVVGGVILVPDVSQAVPLVPRQDEGSVGQEDGASSAVVPIDIDVLTADESSLEGAVQDISENVADQLAALEEAQGAVSAAEAEVVTRRNAVAATQEEIDGLVLLSDNLVIRTYMNPPAERAVDIASTESAIDAAVKQTLLAMQTDEDADILTTLAEARERLEVQEAEEQQAVEAAEDARTEAELALTDLESAVSQQASFALEVEQRSERDLTEIESLREIDPELAEQLIQQQSELASLMDQLRDEAEAEAALDEAGVPPPDDGAVSGPTTIEPVGGGVVAVSCPTGETIQIAGDIARDLESLMNLAAQQGLPMCGNGWRDPQDQVNLRIANCGGDSYYLIYEAPSSACSPPTARPGTSMHERGLAIDFTCAGSAVRTGDSCYNFLSANAATYGFYNLPSESWHWSTDGT